MIEDDYRPTGRDPGIRLYGFFCWWWLRSPGNNQNNAANVNNDGDVNENVLNIEKALFAKFVPFYFHPLT